MAVRWTGRMVDARVSTVGGPTDVMIIRLVTSPTRAASGLGNADWRPS
jgi:hypothetical protein